MLKREVSQLKEGGVVKGGASEGEHMEDLTRLRAENTVLQKSLHGQHSHTCTLHKQLFRNKCRIQVTPLMMLHGNTINTLPDSLPAHSLL